MRIALSLLLLFVACDRWSPRHVAAVHRRVIIFQDITASLHSDESEASQVIVGAIIDKAPAGTEITVIPICENTERAPGVTWVTPFPAGMAPIDRQEAESERAAKKAAVAANADAIRQQKGAIDAHYASCISPALRRATSIAPNHDPNIIYTTEVVFVSDMIEECRNSLLGEPLRLKTPEGEFDAARELVQQDGAPLLDPVFRVVVILPRAPSTAPLKAEYPSPQELESFWRRLFVRAGLRDTNVWWDADTTQYVGSLQ
jgi:hypothetical protein